MAGPHFEISEVDDLIKVGSAALNPSVVYPLGGNIESKTYMHSLPDDLWANWRACSVCGHPQFPAYYILDPTPMSYGASFTVVMPRTLHLLGSYLCQSDAEHPPNVNFLAIVEDSESDAPRYRANLADLFFKAKRELPPGTILYADLAALFEFLSWTPAEAERNADDHAWNESFPAVGPGVYILEAGCASAGSSGAACSLPEVGSSSAVELRVSDNRGAHIISSSATFLVPRTRALRWKLSRWWTALRALLLSLAVNSWSTTAVLPPLVLLFGPQNSSIPHPS